MHIPHSIVILVFVCCISAAVIIGGMHYYETQRLWRDAAIAEEAARESEAALQAIIADAPVVERSISQGETISIFYPTHDQSDLLCNSTPTKYHTHASGILFFVAAQYDMTDDIVCTLGEKTIARIAVTDRKFATTHLAIPPEYLFFTPEQRRRIQSEKAILRDIYANSSHVFHFNMFTSTPYERITSPYGEQRIYQNGTVSVHNGTDFGLGVGDPVYAIGDGTVALARNLYLCGNTVIIDHGLDVFSVYCHLDRMTAAEGQQISANARIGDAGESGLTVGSHLHLAMKVGGVWVDPLAFLAHARAL